MYKVWLISIGILLALGAGAVQFFYPRPALAPASSSPSITSSSATTSAPAGKIATSSPATRSVVVPPLSLAKGDRIASWDFIGAYADSPELTAKADAEITRLTGLVGKGTYTDLSLYVAIANQYELLGEGKQEYDYLGRAIKEGGNASGLPWHNLGALMERLGALETARAAYEEATLVQPEMKFYHYAYMEFLTTRMKDNAAAIEKEFTAAKKDLGQDADILSLYSAWKQS